MNVRSLAIIAVVLAASASELEARADDAAPAPTTTAAAPPAETTPPATPASPATGPAPLSGDVEEPPPPPSDDVYDPKNPPAWATAPPTRRGGFAMGVGVGFGFGASNGFPNDSKKIGYSEYYTESGIGFALGGTVWLGGALGDWVNFGVGGGYTTILADGTKSPAPVGCFHADVYPLFLLGKAWRDLGATFDFGLSFPQTVDADENVLIDGGMSSYLFAGAFWEGISAWQLKMGPSLGLHYIFSDSNRRTAMLAGFRVTVYSQP